MEILWKINQEKWYTNHMWLRFWILSTFPNRFITIHLLIYGLKKISWSWLQQLLLIPKAKGKKLPKIFGWKQRSCCTRHWLLLSGMKGMKRKRIWIPFWIFWMKAKPVKRMKLTRIQWIWCSRNWKKEIRSTLRSDSIKNTKWRLAKQPKVFLFPVVRGWHHLI